MTHILSDIVNPIGAITGIDPVKDATGFNGVTVGPTKAQQQAAKGGQAAPSGGGGGGSGGGGGQLSGLVAQTYGQQQAALHQSAPQQPQAMGSQFGNQLASLANNMGPQAPALPPVASPSATQLAANITAQTVNSKIQDPMRGMQQGQQGVSSMWGFPSIYGPR